MTLSAPDPLPVVHGEWQLTRPGERWTWCGVALPLDAPARDPRDPVTCTACRASLRSEVRSLRSRSGEVDR